MSAMPGAAPRSRGIGRRNLARGASIAFRWRGRLVASFERARRSIASRINLAAIGMTALLVILGFVIAGAATHLGARTEQARVLREVALASAELTASIGETRYRASRHAATGEPAEMEKAREALAGAKRELAATGDSAARMDPAALEALEWLQVQVDGFDQELTALQHSIEAYGPSAGGTSLAAALDVSGEQLAGQARGIQADLLQASAKADADFVAASRQTAMIIATLLLGCIVLTAVGARFVSRTTAGPVREITIAMTSLAGGDREVAIPGTDRVDEIGEMARALAVFRERSDELALLQQEAAEAAHAELARQEAEKVRHTASMHDLARRFERTIGEIAGSVAAASKQLQATAGAMASAAAHSAQVGSDVSQTAAETTAGTTAAAIAGDQFAQAIGKISLQTTHSAARAQEARRSSQKASETMASLAETARQVEQIIAMIDGIAGRTNLLALNASIEAARGGEAGRGFAVVAGEVKNLARQTSAATRTVASQIRAMQGSTDESVAALREVVEHVCEMETSAISIAHSVEEQTLAGQELVRNLAIAAGGADATNRNMVQLGETAEATGTAAGQVFEAASELHGQASLLRQQSEAFLASVRAA